MRKIQLQGLTRLFTPNYRFRFILQPLLLKLRLFRKIFAQESLGAFPVIIVAVF